MGATRTTTELNGGAEPSIPVPKGAGGVTWRAVAISFEIILLSVPAIFYGEVVWKIRYAGDVAKTGIWSTDTPAAWPLTVLFLGAALASLPALRRIGLTRRELLTVHTSGRGQSPFFIPWLAKSLVLRYGGLRLYQQTLPIAVGLITGDVLNRSLWNVISLVTRGHF